jgi:hypothetical protein
MSGNFSGKVRREGEIMEWRFDYWGFACGKSKRTERRLL